MATIKSHHRDFIVTVCLRSEQGSATSAGDGLEEITQIGQIMH